MSVAMPCGGPCVCASASNQAVTSVSASRAGRSRASRPSVSHTASQASTSAPLQEKPRLRGAMISAQGTRGPRGYGAQQRSQPVLIPCFLSPKTSHAPRSRQTTQRNAITDPEKSVGASSGEKDGVRENTKPTKPEKVGVLLLNLGGPEKLEDVQPFLFNLFADPDIIRLPGAVKFLQQPLAALLSANRAPKSREAYASIGGGSPLRRITDAQAEAMKNAMVKKGELDTKVYVGMRYWKPFTEDAVEQIKRDGVTQLIVLPLYPQFSISTSGSSLRLLEQMFQDDVYLRDEMQHTVIPSWYQRPGYVQSMAQLIKGELENPARGFFEDDKPVIFFSAHGVPVSYVESAGDPYKEEMERCVELIMKQLKTLGVHNEHVLAYQSRVGPVEWLKPYTDDVIRDLGKNGTKAMVAVPVSFVSEHIETLEEIDMEYRELAQASGIERWGRAPALDTDKTFIDDLADACLESLATMRGESPAVAGGPAVEDGYESAYDISKSLDVELPDGTKAKKSFGTNLKPPVAMMPAGSGSGAGVPSVGDLLGGFHPEPWRWGILELSFVAVAILLSTMLLMDADTGAGLNETLFR